MKILSLLLVAFGSAMVDGQGVPPYPSDTTPVEYMDNATALVGYLATPEGDGPFPAIVIIPDWDGVDEYEQIRATMVAREWGLVGFAADIYGVMPQFVEDVPTRIELANFYRGNPDVFASRIHAAVEALKAMDNVDANNVALFGYCFGGTGVLQYGLYGNDDVQAIVSFHGGLRFFPEVPEVFGPKLLVLSGGDDNTPEQIMDLEILLDTAQAPWEITRYSGIQHAFTVWFDNRYDEFVDMQSWDSAGNFVLEAFGIAPHESALPVVPAVVPVDYVGSMDNATLRGYLAMPDDTWERPLPAVIVLPDWDGVNGMEQERATALAKLGYFAMAADIFGADKQEGLEIPERIDLVTKFSTDPALYVARIQDAIAQVKMVSGVAPEEIGMIGYCFGGSGAVLYSFFDGSEAKVAVAFHGSFSQLPPVLVDSVSPYLLILSGGDDGLHGNQTVMEAAFELGDASWEITRYAGLGHGYTVPGNPSYDIVGDARSWLSMLEAFGDFMAVPQQVGSTPAPAVPTPAPVDAIPDPTAVPTMATTAAPPVTSPPVDTTSPPVVVDTDMPTESATETPEDGSAVSFSLLNCGVAAFVAALLV